MKKLFSNKLHQDDTVYDTYTGDKGRSPIWLYMTTDIQAN